MAQKSISIPQLDLFVSQSPAYQEAVDRYEAIRPILKEEQTLSQHRHPETGISYGRLRRYLQRFRGYGLQGLVDQRKLPHRRGRPPVEAVLPEPIQQHIVRLAIAHPFTCRELARIIQEGYGHRVDHRGIQQVLEHHHLSPEVLALHRHQAQQAPPPPLPVPAQMALPLVPTTRGQRLVQALGPEHLLIRFRTYREYPTEEQARWRIIELLDVGFRPRRVAALLAIRPVVVYAWNRRFKEAGGMSAFLLDGFGQFILQNPLKYLFPPHFPPLLRRSGR
jgi:transposase